MALLVTATLAPLLPKLSIFLIAQHHIAVDFNQCVVRIAVSLQDPAVCRLHRVVLAPKATPAQHTFKTRFASQAQVQVVLTGTADRLTNQFCWPDYLHLSFIEVLHWPGRFIRRWEPPYIPHMPSECATCRNIAARCYRIDRAQNNLRRCLCL